MPKMKTDKGAAKRIKVTGSGKLRRRHAFLNHILEKKSADRKRRLGNESDVAPADRRPGQAPARQLTRRHRPVPAPRPKGAPMARVKRAVHGKKHRRAVLERAQGYYGNKSRQLPLRQRAGHALAGLRLPRPPGPQGRLPPAVDPAHQRRRPAARDELQPLHRRAQGWPRSRSTARSSPTWRSPTRPRSVPGRRRASDGAGRAASGADAEAAS